MGEALSTLEPTGIIYQPESLAKMTASLYTDSGVTGDVTFAVEGRHFTAHRAILATQSPVFRAMLFGNGFKESTTPINSNNNNDDGAAIKLPNKRAAPFEFFLKYLYTCSIETARLDLNTAIDLLQISHEYQVEDLVKSIVSVLTPLIGEETVLKIYETALLLGEESLSGACRRYLFENAEDVLKNPNFCELSKQAVIDIVSQDLFCAPEIDILMAVNAWHQQNSDENVRDVLEKIRFPLVSLNGMTMARVAPLYQLLINNGIDLDKIGQQDQSISPTIQPRKELIVIPEDNVAKLSNGVTVEGLDAALWEKLFQERLDTTGYLAISFSVKIKLPKAWYSDSLSFDIYTSGGYGVAYKVKTSIDNLHWNVLIDCSNLKCYSRQLIMFEPRKVRYVKIKGFRPPSSTASFLKYGIAGFQCPCTKLISDNRARCYLDKCPNGETLLLQASGNATVYPNNNNNS